MLLGRLWDLRGYGFLLLIPLAVALRGAVVAAIDVGLILLILAFSKDGRILFGDLSRRIQSSKWMGTPQAQALLMVVPVKTCTALMGAESDPALREVALHATIGLIVLTVLLGLALDVFKRFSDDAPAPSQRDKAWIVALDVTILALLIALGRDGQAVFGDGATRLQNSLPLLHEPWMRGFIAAIPVKTLSTLVLAGSWQRRREITMSGIPLMATLAVLTFGVAFASELGKGWAYIVGAVLALAMLQTTRNYRAVLLKVS